jgi:hypothetical protein
MDGLQTQEAAFAASVALQSQYKRVDVAISEHRICAKICTNLYEDPREDK